jgi:PE-PPE domain
MSTAKHIGRIGALAVALGIGTARRDATLVTVSIGIAALVVMAAAAPVSTESPAVKLSADSTALLLCGTACPTWNDAHVEDIKNQFIAPTHPGDIDYTAVTAPMEVWPLTGGFRFLGLLGFGEPGCARPGGDCWPDYPLWRLSGLFDLTYDQSVQAGVADLEAAMAAAGNDHLVIYGDSQGTNVANVMKRKLAEQYPDGTAAPDIDFVLTGDWNVPNGGLHARFPGFYVPIGWTFDGPEPTDTQFDTDVIIRQYDGAADFPLYPLDFIATLNALLGVVYVHPFLFDVSLQPDPTATPATVSQHGDTTYYFFPTQDLPLFGPLRTLGVPEPLIDVVEPFFRVLVELGYDRTIPPGEPTPARLIPPLDPAKLITDLLNAIGEGATNAAALSGAPAPLGTSAPVTLAAPAGDTGKVDISPSVESTDTHARVERVTSTEPATESGQMSTDTAGSTTVTETAKAAASPSARPTPERSASGLTPKPTKSRPGVGNPLGVVRQIPDRFHRGESDQPNTRTPAAATEKAATGTLSPKSSLSAASSSTANSSGGGSSDGDSGRSE